MVSLTPVSVLSGGSGTNVINHKNSFAVAGEGAIAANTPMVQEKSIFEVKVIKEGPFSYGIGDRQTDFEKDLAGQPHAWSYNSEDHSVTLAGEKVPITKSITIKLGDIFVRSSFNLPSSPLRVTLCFPPFQGCTFDQQEVKFYHNGNPLQFEFPLSVRPLRGPVTPVFSGAPFRSCTFQWTLLHFSLSLSLSYSLSEITR